MASTLIRLTRRVLPLAFPSNARPFTRAHRSYTPLQRFTRSLASRMKTPSISYLNQPDAAALDVDLMGDLQFSIDQLMELAGLSVASAIASEYSPQRFPRVLVIAGPGNNGGDGLVAARHLTHFGHTVQLLYPIPSNKKLYDNLLAQCETLSIKMCRPNVLEGNGLSERFDLVVDAIFGFSFRGEPRPPFDAILAALKPEKNPPKIISIDIPSGWHVEKGDAQGNGIRPDMLVSLSAPKECARHFEGAHHYLGGRFLPPSLTEKFRITLPSYSGNQQCVRLAGAESTSQLDAMRISYESEGIDEAQLHADPIEQFKLWFEEHKNLGVVREPNAMILATCGENARPSARYVLLKGLNHGGFVFYTNYESKKGNQIEENAHAALCFYMEALHRQIRVEGVVRRLPTTESDAYFSTRPRGSQIGAWASQQSSVLSSRQEIEEKERKITERFADVSQSVPRPDNWGGYVVVPLTVEFWQGRAARLHDRCEYYRDTVDAAWCRRRLSP